MKRYLFILLFAWTADAQYITRTDSVSKFPDNPTLYQEVVYQRKLWTYTPGGWLIKDGTYIVNRDSVLSTPSIGGAADWNTLANKPATFPPDAHSHPPFFVAVLPADSATGANVTPISLRGMVFSYTANSVYIIRVIGAVSPAAATTGCGFQLDVSTPITHVYMQTHHQLATTGTSLLATSIADDASATVTTGMPANGGVYPIMVDGVLSVGNNTGTAQLRFRSETTAATTAKAGMVLIVEKVR